MEGCSLAWGGGRTRLFTRVSTLNSWVKFVRKLLFIASHMYYCLILSRTLLPLLLQMGKVRHTGSSVVCLTCWQSNSGGLPYWASELDLHLAFLKVQAVPEGAYCSLVLLWQPHCLQQLDPCLSSLPSIHVLFCPGSCSPRSASLQCCDRVPSAGNMTIQWPDSHSSMWVMMSRPHHWECLCDFPH